MHDSYIELFRASIPWIFSEPPIKKEKNAALLSVLLSADHTLAPSPGFALC